MVPYKLVVCIRTYGTYVLCMLLSLQKVVTLVCTYVHKISFLEFQNLIQLYVCIDIFINGKLITFSTKLCMLVETLDSFSYFSSKILLYVPL